MFKKLKMDQNILSLPHKILVRLSPGEKSGVIIAELIEYDVFTEVDSLLELDDLINDLIYTLFEVPKEFQKAIRYEPLKSKKEISTDLGKQITFLKFISSEADRIFT